MEARLFCRRHAREGGRSKNIEGAKQAVIEVHLMKQVLHQILAKSGGHFPAPGSAGTSCHPRDRALSERTLAVRQRRSFQIASQVRNRIKMRNY